jgi:hypothetical protein
MRTREHKIGTQVLSSAKGGLSRSSCICSFCSLASTDFTTSGSKLRCILTRLILQSVSNWELRGQWELLTASAHNRHIFRAHTPDTEASHQGRWCCTVHIPIALAFLAFAICV